MISFSLRRKKLIEFKNRFVELNINKFAYLIVKEETLLMMQGLIVQLFFSDLSHFNSNLNRTQK